MGCLCYDRHCLAGWHRLSIVNISFESRPCGSPLTTSIKISFTRAFSTIAFSFLCKSECGPKDLLCAGFARSGKVTPVHDQEGTVLRSLRFPVPFEDQSSPLWISSTQIPACTYTWLTFGTPWQSQKGPAVCRPQRRDPTALTI